MRLIVAHCSVVYSGRLSTTLPAALRLVVVKSDGSVMIHADHGGYRPDNWMTAPTLIEEHEDGWSDLWDDTDELWSFVADRDGEPIGGIVMYRRPTGDLRVPDDNVDLAFAATWPNVRGSGAGVALTHHVLGWAHDHGFRSVTTDWRSVNLLSSRFWPRRGFRPQYLRLYRAVP